MSCDVLKGKLSGVFYWREEWDWLWVLGVLVQGELSAYLGKRLWLKDKDHRSSVECLFDCLPWSLQVPGVDVVGWAVATIDNLANMEVDM